MSKLSRMVRLLDKSIKFAQAEAQSRQPFVHPPDMEQYGECIAAIRTIFPLGTITLRVYDT